MPLTTIAGRQIHVDEEGFLTDPAEWDRALAAELAKAIGIDMTDRHWEMIDFLRADFATQHETATSRRVQIVGGFPVKEQFDLFPKKPAKKMAYVAGLPKPRGCV